MNNKYCLMTIKNKYNSLTGAEKKIADYILKNSEQVILMSVSELAEKSDSVKSAVIRTCKSLGFEGYSELKISLAMELSKNKQLNFMPYISPEDNPEDILDKVFSANIKTLHDTAQKIDRDIMNKLVEALSSTGAIYIYGIGTSSSLVNEFQYRLMQLGFTSFCFTDVPSMKISTMNIKKGDVAIGISNSGRTVATIDALKLAKEQGAKIACITSYHKSPITQVCDYPIEVYTDEIQYPIEAISARIAHLSVIDALSISLSSKDYENALNRSKKAHELINTMRV